MSERLQNFLVDLASDPDRMARFMKDPGAELDGVGLSADERAAVISRDAAQLRRALGQRDNDTMTQIGQGARKYPKKKSTKRTAKKTARSKRSKGKGKRR